MGKAPTELAGGGSVVVTRVAFNPRSEVVAAGFADGRVILGEIEGGRVLPVMAPGRGPVSALSWNEGGSHLAIGTETGFADHRPEQRQQVSRWLPWASHRGV